jgi:hypothetical protein
MMQQHREFRISVFPFCTFLSQCTGVLYCCLVLCRLVYNHEFRLLYPTLYSDVHETPSDFLQGDLFFFSFFFVSCTVFWRISNLILTSEPLDFLVVCYEDFELERIRKEAALGVIGAFILAFARSS